MINTAMTRKTISAPLRNLLKGDLLDSRLDGEWLDYGCGKGLDADTYNMDKYDPLHHPEPLVEEKKYDVVFCTYVLNVIADKEERKEVVSIIRSKLKKDGVAYITVRRDREQFSDRQHWVELDLPSLTKNSDYETYELRVSNTNVSSHN